MDWLRLFSFGLFVDSVTTSAVEEEAWSLWLTWTAWKLFNLVSSISSMFLASSKLGNGFWCFITLIMWSKFSLRPFRRYMTSVLSLTGASTFCKRSAINLRLYEYSWMVRSPITLVHKSLSNWMARASLLLRNWFSIRSHNSRTVPPTLKTDLNNGWAKVP